MRHTELGRHIFNRGVRQGLFAPPWKCGRPTRARSAHPPVHTPPWQERPPLQAVPLALGGGELHTPVARLHVLWPCLHSLWGGQVTPTHMSGVGGRWVRCFGSLSASPTWISKRLLTHGI
jgi:hypothetical protein